MPRACPEVVDYSKTDNWTIIGFFDWACNKKELLPTNVEATVESDERTGTSLCDRIGEQSEHCSQGLFPVYQRQ